MDSPNKFRPLFSRLGVVTLLAITVVSVVTSLLLITPSTASLPPKSAEQDSQLWNVHMYAIPSPNAITLRVAVEGVGNICEGGEVIFNTVYLGAPIVDPTPRVGIPGPNREIFLADVEEFFPGCEQLPLPCTEPEDGSLEVICKLPNGDTLTTPTIIFTRYYAPDDGEVSMVTNPDNLAELRSFPTSLETGRYVIAMATNTWLGQAPTGVEFVSAPYTFRDWPGSLPAVENMSITMFSAGDRLGNADPLTLSMFRWDVNLQDWVDIGAQTNVADFIRDETKINNPTKAFTTYVLGLTPLWCDRFTDSSRGLEGRSLHNIQQITASGGRLKLKSTTMPGSAYSKPYTPAMEIEAWEAISYTANIPNGTAGGAITVSVLSGADPGLVLKADVDSGQSLADIDPLEHPSLRLRVDMSTTSGVSPELFDWCILARPAESELPTIYLPLVLKLS